jgi:hypothetical protein
MEEKARSSLVNPPVIGGKMANRLSLVFLVSSVFLLGLFSAPAYCAKEPIPKVGPVKMNAHPSSLEGKTVLLRWNGKYNGDKFLSRIGELLAQQIKNVKVVRLWESDKSTAAISESLKKSEEISEKILNLKPDIVIAAQAD